MLFRFSRSNEELGYPKFGAKLLGLGSKWDPLIPLTNQTQSNKDSAAEGFDNKQNA
jgi:hypothetical protein